MANTFAIDQTHRTSPKHGHIGLVKASVVSTETYATPTGVTINLLTDILTPLGIAHADVVHISGMSATGYIGHFTKTATNGAFTLRLFNGITEIADGAINQTVTLLIWYNQGAPN